MYRPAWRRKHQVPRLPAINLPFDSRASRSVEIVVDRRRCVTMRPVDNLRWTDRYGGEKIRRCAVGAPGHRIVQKIKPPPDIVLSQRLKLVEMRLDLFPWPEQGRRGN